jgi:AcrR family transcriptional regulator
LPAAERRQQIADAALRILAERGPHHLTALAVAREVGVADASLFKHFAGMEAIVEAAIERFGEALAADLQRPESDPVDKLAGFFAARLATLRARPELLQVAFNERLADAAGIQGALRVKAITARSREFALQCLQKGQQTGQFRADVPAPLLFMALSGVMRGAALAGADEAALPLAAPAAWAALERLLGPVGAAGGSHAIESPVDSPGQSGRGDHEREQSPFKP